MPLAGLAAVALTLQSGVTEAQAVYPSGPTVPANLLRFSLRFEVPQHPSIASAVELRSAGGRVLDNAIFPQALWTPDRRTLTLYLDPGRVKSGTELHASAGPLLKVGDTVEVCLGRRVLQRWRIVPARAEPLRLTTSEVAPPRSATRDTLLLRFATPIDWQGKELIAVQQPTGERLMGAVTLARGETDWSFRPTRPWTQGKFIIRVHPALEDAEGNRLDRPFETRGGEVDSGNADTRIAFVVGPATPDDQSRCAEGGTARKRRCAASPARSDAQAARGL